MSKVVGAVATLIFLSNAASAQLRTPETSASSADLHARAVAAIPEAHTTLDNTLTDYPSARFRDVHARLVRSVYASDNGHSDKVPWTHRGGVVLVMCGEINAKNRMGGYTGWTPFVFEPSQTDVVTMYSFDEPRKPMQVNLAEEPKLRMATDWYEEESIALLCGEGAEAVDAADLSKRLAFS